MKLAEGDILELMINEKREAPTLNVSEKKEIDTRVNGGRRGGKA